MALPTTLVSPNLFLFFPGFFLSWVPLLEPRKFRQEVNSLFLAAINLAISDGGRCGASCGSSTIYPAVVYFPPGDYLVSSPIIQYFNTQILGDV